MPAKSFKTKIIPMGNAHWACIRIPSNVEREFGIRARVAKTLTAFSEKKTSKG